MMISRRAARTIVIGWVAVNVLAILYHLVTGATWWRADPEAPGPTETFRGPYPLPSPSKLPHLIHQLAIGSCSHVKRELWIFEAIRLSGSDAFVWLGDAVYADRPWRPYLRHTDRLRTYYQLMKASEPYRQLRCALPIFGVWDDHDYGQNDSGAEFPHREASQQLYLDFVDEPLDSPRRSQRGIYAAYDLPGPDHPKQIKLILLDIRYHATSHDLLGPDQWRWLEDTLATSNADIHLIGSGIQVLPDRKFIVENWAKVPESRRRLLNMIQRYRCRNPIILSGDVHYAEVLKMPKACFETPHTDITELCSSGLTHTCSDQLGVWCSYFLKYVNYTPYDIPETTYTGRNFGVVQFLWSAKTIRLQIRDIEGRTVSQVDVAMSDDRVSDDRPRCDRANTFFHRLKPFVWIKILIQEFLMVSGLALIATMLFVTGVQQKPKAKPE